MTRSWTRGHPLAAHLKARVPRPTAVAEAPAWWQPLATSVTFLTVFPIPRTGVSAASLGKATALFPVVGAALGALLGSAGLLLDRMLPPAPTAALLLLAGTALTGALHLDGFMDTADGVFGARTAERRLAIMRDSRVGAFGVTAGILVILSQFACLVELTGVTRLTGLVVVYATSRWAMTLALGVFPPARPDGLGATFHAACGRAPLVAGTLFAAIVALAVSPLSMVMVAGGAVVALAGGYVFTRLLGGLTGDTYGALAVLVETLGLYIAVALLTVGSGS